MNLAASAAPLSQKKAPSTAIRLADTLEVFVPEETTVEKSTEARPTIYDDPELGPALKAIGRNARLIQLRAREIVTLLRIIPTHYPRSSRHMRFDADIRGNKVIIHWADQRSTSEFPASWLLVEEDEVLLRLYAISQDKWTLQETVRWAKERTKELQKKVADYEKELPRLRTALEQVQGIRRTGAAHQEALREADRVRQEREQEEAAQQLESMKEKELEANG